MVSTSRLKLLILVYSFLPFWSQAVVSTASVCAAGAGSFWHAAPSKHLHLDIEPELFKVMLQRWLRIPIATEDSVCHLCDRVLDKYGDHCLTCDSGGDRTRRHNLLRNLVYQACETALLAPELEKPGLLPARPSDEAGATCHADDNSARRPADVYLPRWKGGPPAALDFAVTSGMRMDALQESSLDREAPCRRYEDHKKSYKNTAILCEHQGFKFLPMVAEANGGGWGHQARIVFSEIAKLSASASGELTTDSDHGVLLTRRLSVVLHRENARAVLRRFSTGGSALPPVTMNMMATLAESC